MKRHFSRTRCQGFLLRGMGCPTGHMKNFKRHGDPAIGSTVFFCVNLDGALENVSAERLTGTLSQNVGLSHAAQVLKQIDQAGVVHGNLVGVYNWQGKAGALQKPPQIANFGKWRNAGTDAAANFAFGLQQGCAQVQQSFSAKEGRQKQAIGPERAPGLNQGAWQVIDMVQSEAGGDEIKAGLGEGHPFFIGNDSRRVRRPFAGASSEAQARVRLNEKIRSDGAILEARVPGKGCRKMAKMGAGVPHARKVAVEIQEPF